jgi:AcrR family transcriptional regulator
VPQHSNRSALIQGTLRCLESLPAERVTARAIAEASGANLASITYHFGSKDDLVAAAIIEGLDRWLGDMAKALEQLPDASPVERFGRAARWIEATRKRHRGLAVNFLSAMARAQHEPRIRESLTAGFFRTRATLATVLGLGSDQAGHDASGLLLALFDGLLFQTLLDPSLAIEGRRMTRAQRRLLRVLPAPRKRRRVSADRHS